MIKRYVAFIFERYYPNGGMEDCVGFFDDIEEAKTYMAQPNHPQLSSTDAYAMGHIFDIWDNKIVWAFDNYRQAHRPTEVDASCYPEIHIFNQHKEP